MPFEKQELKLRFSTRPEYTHKIFDIVEKLLDIIVLDKTGHAEFIIALGEALDNAIVHGNKQQPDKFIELACSVDDIQIACSITNDGPGFAYKERLANPIVDIDPKKLIFNVTQGKLGGLGINLIRKCVSEVRFNEAGNQITLIKYIQSKSVRK